MTDTLTRMLREAFEGAPGPWTYFTDTSPGAGLFGTLSGLNAGQASQVGGPGGTTIAAHVHHLSSSLALSIRALRGDRAPPDRRQTWTVSVVDARAWVELQGRVRREYENLLRTVEARSEWDDDALGVALGAIAHTAYHLGAIRQRL